MNQGMLCIHARVSVLNGDARGSSVLTDCGGQVVVGERSVGTGFVTEAVGRTLGTCQWVWLRVWLRLPSLAAAAVLLVWSGSPPPGLELQLEVPGNASV